MTQNNDHDFQQFRGQFDDAMIPDAAFKAKMENLLQKEQPVEAERAPTVLASPPKQSSATEIPAGRSHPLMIAAAVLTVFAVVVASVWVLSGDVLEGDYATAPGGVATLPADVPLAPGADVHLEANLLAGTEDIGHLHGIYDGIAIYQTRSDDVVQEDFVQEIGSEATPEPYGLDRSLIAVDIQTGEQVWERERTIFESLNLGEDILIGSQLNVSIFGEVRDYTLTGINLQTGEELWSISVPDAKDRTHNSSGWFVLVIDNLIVIPGSDGIIRAWDSQTGELVWESEFDPGLGRDLEWVSPGDTHEIVHQKTYAAVAWNDYIVLVNDANTLQVLDSKTGKNVSSYPLSDMPNINFRLSEGTLLQLLPMKSHIILLGSIPGSDGEGRSIAVAFDPLTEEIRWTQEFDGGIGSPSTSEDGTLAINSQKWHENNWFLQLLGQSGYSSNQFYWFDGETGEEILHTERTKDMRLYNFAVTNGKNACIRTEITEIVCLDRAGTRHIIDIELSGYLIFEDNVLYIPTGDGLIRVELP